MAIHPLPNRNGVPAQRIGRGIDRVVRSLGLPSAGSVTSIFSEWEIVVGPEIAAHCRPTALRKAHLTITADDQAWATELKWMEQAIVDRCAVELGADVITSVSVVVDTTRS